MIERSDLLAFHFYKKEKFTGSYCGMRYLIEKTTEGEAELFAVYTWPQPYNFEATLQEDKCRKTFPFTAESLEEITDYLNRIYENGYHKKQPNAEKGTRTLTPRGTGT